MTEYKFNLERFRAQYEADRENRANNPAKYPWFMYKQFGWHTMSYLTDEEKDGAVAFYHLKRIGDKWERYGRQPITIMRRGD